MYLYTDDMLINRFLLQELLSAIAGFIAICEQQFMSVARQLLEEETIGNTVIICVPLFFVLLNAKLVFIFYPFRFS